jgi:hypothetical protein
MAIGLSRAAIEAEVSRDLMYSGLDQRAQMKIAEAIAEAIDKNNRRIQEQLEDSAIAAALQGVISEPQPMIRRAGAI